MITPHHVAVLVMAALMLSCYAGSGAHADDAHAACFATVQTSIPHSEKRIRHHDRSFDAEPKWQPQQDHKPITEKFRGAIRRVELEAGSRKLIALTFDLCEQRGEIAGFDSEIFEVLKKAQVRATLFAGGKWMRSHQQRTSELMRNPQFELANHSDTHRNINRTYGLDRIREIRAPQTVYASYRQRLLNPQCKATAGHVASFALPARLSAFRFPYGVCDQSAINAVNDAGMLVVQWDVSSGDPDRHASVAAIAANIVRGTRPGSIILAHANGRGWKTAKALKLAIPRLRAAGFEFVTVAELLRNGKPISASSCYDSRPGDTDRYDRGGRGVAARRAKAVSRAELRAKRKTKYRATSPSRRPRRHD